MKTMILIALVMLIVTGLAGLGTADVKKAMPGEELFKRHCADCHPEGGNIINPRKTLRKADRETHNIREKADIVEKMRHPGKGMTSWSAAVIPDREAAMIADYILMSF